MANETISTSVDELAAVVSQEAKSYAINTGDLSQIIWTKQMAVGAISQKFPYFTAASGSITATSEGSEADISALTTGGVTLTPADPVIKRFMISDTALNNSPLNTGEGMNLLLQAARNGVDSIKAKINLDIINLFSGLTDGGGTTNTNITEALIINAARLLRKCGAPVGPRYLALSPTVVSDVIDLYKSSTSLVAVGAREAAAMGGLPAKLYGLTPYEVDSGWADDNSNADYIVAAFAPEAIGMAVKGEPYQVEITRRPSFKSWEVCVSMTYAVALVNASWGIRLLVDGD